MGVDPSCVICGNRLRVGSTVTVTKGLQTLINDSITLTCMTVHVECSKCYTIPSSMVKAISHQDDKVSENKTSRRAENSAFDFQNHCLFCDEASSAKVETKIAQKYRKVQKTTYSKAHFPTFVV
ncbi:hypothetical protein AVEN_193787-1 [Araneus ventricosus]|uniref:Uncharacterized protein n=1 Tax=Araneus ventricosus TaxID=182803 RepID=A0A4Y2DL32_ARAVE|nr:hypothetical protein AVEN_193787-1 [Araneus ventricosus]